MTEIGNCPWCGTSAEVWGSPNGRHGVCPACYARGPASAGEPEAIAAWNRLAGPGVVIGRLRWVQWSGGQEEHLYCGATQVGSIWPVLPDKWAGRVRFADASTIPPRTQEAARAALVEAVKAAMGGGE